MPQSVSDDDGEGQPTTGFGGTIFLQQAAHVTVLDGRGRIITVNDAWIRFGRENGLNDGYQFVGVSYPEVCERAIGGAHDAEGAREALGGVTSVLDAREKRFSLVYPCHAPQKQRWFLMYARPSGGRADGAVVSHIDVTSLHLAGLVPDESVRRAGATASSKAIVDKLAQMLFPNPPPPPPLQSSTPSEPRLR